MNKLKILIADDEEFLQELYEMILEPEVPCQFVKFFNANTAIEALKADSTFDLIISDYNMPGSNGGKLYLFNKENQKIPFFLMSGGILKDYKEFNDFKETNSLNQFFNKPFEEEELITATKRILEIKYPPSAPAEAPSIDSQYVKVKLSHYLDFTTSSTDVFIKLSDNKYTKIANINPENQPEIDLLKHYQSRGIEFIYIGRAFFHSLVHDIYNRFHQGLLNPESPDPLILSGIPMNINLEGLRQIGLNDFQIQATNDHIESVIKTLLQNPKSQEQFQKFCEQRGFAIGHSMLLIYMAGRICLETELNFASTMKKICMAAFYHDLSLFDSDAMEDELRPIDISDPELLKRIINHPYSSAEYLTEGMEIIEDTRKIILEHHELPEGDGYPKKLTAHQISPLSCLFILSHHISLCLLRNEFSKERLSDYLVNSAPSFRLGNFAKFYKACEIIFVQDTSRSQNAG